ILTVDPACRIANQERDDPGNFLRLSKTAERRGLDQIAARRIVNVSQQHRGLGKARRNEIDSDSARRNLPRKRAAELLDCRLASEIAGPGGEIQDGADRRYAHYPASVG